MKPHPRICQSWKPTSRAALRPGLIALLMVAGLGILLATSSLSGQSSSWVSVGTGDCPGQDVKSSAGPTPDPAKCDAAFDGFTAVCWSGACTYKNVPTASCTGGTHPGNMYRCEALGNRTAASPAAIEVAPQSTPVVSQVAPNQAPRGTVLTVMIVGRDFAPGVTLSTYSSDLRVGSTRRLSSMQVEAQLIVSPNAPVGTASLYVHNPASVGVALPFTITAGTAPAPPPVSPVGTPAAPVDLGTSWSVVENNVWFGTWTRRPGTNLFDAYWKNQAGQSLHDVLELQPPQGNTITLYRQGNKGRYTGTLSPDGKQITGTASWYEPGQSWTGTIRGTAGSPENVVGEWKIQRGGLVGSPDENTPAFSGMLVIWDEGGTYHARFASERRDTWEDITDVTVNGNILSFTRSGRRGEPQDYRLTISGNHLDGTWRQGTQTYKAWGTKGQAR